MLCEFDYSLKPTPTIPLIDTTRERYATWLLKRYGLPWLYWRVMMRGRDVPFLGQPLIANPSATVQPGYAG